MPAMGAVHRIITGASAGRTQVQIPGSQPALFAPQFRFARNVSRGAKDQQQDADLRHALRQGSLVKPISTQTAAGPTPFCINLMRSCRKKLKKL